MEFKDAADKIFKATLCKTYGEPNFEQRIAASQYLDKVYSELYLIENESLSLEKNCAKCVDLNECKRVKRALSVLYILDALKADEQLEAHQRFFGDSLEENIDKILESSKIVYKNVSKISVELVNHSALSKPE